MIQVCNELDIPLKQFRLQRERAGTFALDKLYTPVEAAAREKLGHSAADPKLEALSAYLADIRKAKTQCGYYIARLRQEALRFFPFRTIPAGKGAYEGAAKLLRMLNDNDVTVLYHRSAVSVER
jgi:hypothetical protein